MFTLYMIEGLLHSMYTRKEVAQKPCLLNCILEHIQQYYY
jgi:hypothetical protein